MVQEMAQAHWEPPEPEPRVRVARFEQIPQFEWLYSRLPTRDGIAHAVREEGRRYRLRRAVQPTSSFFAVGD